MVAAALTSHPSETACDALKHLWIVVLLSDCDHHCLHFVPLEVCNLVGDIDVDRCGETELRLGR